MTQPHNPDSTDNRPSNLASQPLGDEDLGSLIRDVADSWSMPPIQFDEAGWRQRVRSPRALRSATLRHWTGRLAQAAAGGLVLAVGAALLGVWLTRPQGPASPTQRPGQSEAHRTTPGPSQVAASQLPKLFVNGDLPSPSQLIVNVESAFSLVDLGSGTISQAVAQGQSGTVVRRDPNGVLYCLCLAGDSYQGGSFTHMTATWNRYDGTGSIVGTALVGDFRGAPSPDDAALADQSQNVAVHVTYGPDPNLAFVGWSLHAHPVWKSGIVVVDITSGAVIQRFELPDREDGTDTSRSAVDAPRIAGPAGGGRLVIARPWYRWSPPASSNPTYHFSTDAYIAAFDGSQLSGAETIAAAAQCGDRVSAAGTLTGGAWWLGCVSDASGQTLVRRVAADGQILGETRVTGILDIASDSASTSALSPDGTAVFLWDPISAVLTRVDLATGLTSTGTGDRTAEAGSPLAALGRWLTPTVAAKVLLSSGIAISPDGSRIYALGITNDETGQLPAGSAGVFVFDTSSLAQVAHWNATADFVSLAVSSDGRYVFAAGSPQSNAGGTATEQAASITVFDAENGSVRLIAGQLGSGFLLLPSTTVK